MLRKFWLTALMLGGVALLLFTFSSTRPAQAETLITVYKSPTCQCCSGWIEHLREQGFTVVAEDVADVRPIKDRYGIDSRLFSCHTAIVNGKVVEGHVPAHLIRDFLANYPDAVGISAPGMPVGSPGMEVPGAPSEPYPVYSWDKDGTVSRFATVTP